MMEVDEAISRLKELYRRAKSNSRERTEIRKDDIVDLLRHLDDTYLITKYYPPEIYNQSSESMTQVPDDSVHLVITSPPYLVGKGYDVYDDAVPWEVYRSMLEGILSECYRVLVPGGRIAVNVANLERKPYRPLVNVIEALLVQAGFDLKGEIIWQKWENATTTAWGSWMEASNPALRDTHEYILIGVKGMETPIEKPEDGIMTLTREEFLEYTNSVWKIPPASSPNHPAIFPEEIPARLIKLFTYTGCRVLDPFAGTGTTVKVAKDLGRIGIGYELSAGYYQLMKERVGQGVQLSLDRYWDDYFKELHKL